MIDVFSQGYEAALMFCVGIATRLLYDLFTALGQRRGPLVRHLLDAVLLLLIAALLLFGVLLCSNGTMRAFYLAFDALGAVLTARAFRPLVRRSRTS